MPNIEQIDRHQTAAYWEAAGAGEDGVQRVKEPVDIKVRWRYNHRESINAQGEVVAVNASIVSDFLIPAGSILRLGTVAEATATPGDFMYVLASSKTPDIKNRFNRYTADLMRYGESLPSLVPGTGTGS